MKDFGNSDLSLPRIPPCHPELKFLVEDLETLHLSLVKTPPPTPTQTGTSHGGLKEFFIHLYLYLSRIPPPP